MIPTDHISSTKKDPPAKPLADLFLLNSLLFLIDLCLSSLYYHYVGQSELTWMGENNVLNKRLRQVCQIGIAMLKWILAE